HQGLSRDTILVWNESMRRYGDGRRATSSLETDILRKRNTPIRRLAILFLLCTAALALQANAQRLPDTVTPHHYILKFSPDLKTAKFGGEETIHGDINH